MDFQLTEEQSLIKSSASEIANDLAGLSAKEALQVLADIDFLGIFFPEEYGGAGGDFLSYFVALKEFAHVSASAALGYAVHCTQAGYTIWKYGTKSAKENYLQALCSGQMIGSYAHDEGWIGRDVALIETKAEKDAAGFRITGQKTFVYNGRESDLLIIFANTEKGLSAFVVGSDLPGVKISEPYRKMGLDLISEHTVNFDKVYVPAENLLGEEGEGQIIAKCIFDVNSISLSAIAEGITHCAIEKAIAYGKERKQFNRPIIFFDGLSEKLGKMIVDLEASELLTEKAVQSLTNGEDIAEQAYAARYFALKTGEQICVDAIQLHGGYGYSKDLGVESLLRDIKGLSVFETLTKPMILSIAAEAVL